jgi:hypothetical protein
VLDGLLVAGGVFERGETRRMRRGTTRFRASPAARGRDHSRSADYAADEERANTVGSTIGALHGA